MMRQADVIVIGAGVLGTFHAHYAALLGYRTLLLERDAAPNGASTRNFGIIAQSIVDPTGEWAAFARDTAEIYRAIQRERDISVRGTGALYLASTGLEDTVLREFAERFGATYNCAYLEAREALARYPFVRASYCVGALLFPDDLTVEPRRMLAQLIPYVTRPDRGDGGVEYIPHTAVVAVEPSGRGCTVRDARGAAFAAERVVVCNGADVQTLFSDLFRASGLRVCKLQMMQTAPSTSDGFRLPHAILSGLSILRYPAFASCPSYEALRAQPMDDSLRAYGIHLLFKGGQDGSVVIGDSHEYRDPADVSALQETTDCAVAAAILRYGQTMLELPSWTPRMMWNGYYLTHPERDVYTHAVDDAIHIVTGIGGKGMTTGPAFARHSIDALLR